MEQWSNYFVVTAGGAAALAGLIFVSVSLNLNKILSLKQLPGRALESLILLINILISGSFSLIPGQNVFYLGIEIITCGGIAWLLNTRMDVKMFFSVSSEHRHYYLLNLIFTQLAILPYIIAGVLMLNNSTAGVYWLVPGITLSFIKGLLDAWVLLVEINR